MAENGEDKDELTGIETTGHEWDGLRELNNPAPRWWLWVFYVTIIWSVWYWVIYPAWPTLSGATAGSKGYTQFKELADSQKEIIARQASHLESFQKAASFSQIQNDESLYAFAVAGGKTAFKDNCATCHGTGGAGAKGYPNLNDDDWLWGGRIEEIYRTLQYGIRTADSETHYSLMPAFGRDRMLPAEDIDTVADYVLALSKGEAGTSHQGYQIFQDNCASCHGVDGKGGRDFGAPNLADAIWLFGSDDDTVYQTIYYGRGGVMPNWKGRLDDDTIRMLAVYVHSLGGGE